MIEGIVYAIASLGIVLVLILVARLMRVDEELKLKKHRSKDAGLVDLLNHASVADDGVIVGKNGSLMASWLYKGDDNASSTDEQREMVSMRINQAFSRMGNGWMIHVDAVRRPSPRYPARNRSHFTDPVTEAMDEERRRLFQGLSNMYEGYFVLTVTFFPPILAEQKFTELMFDDDSVAPDEAARTTTLLDGFTRDCKNIESKLSSAIALNRLVGHKVQLEDGNVVTHDDFLSWIQYCVTGITQPIILPRNPMFIDALIGAQEFEPGVIPKIGEKFIQVVSIDGFPLECYPGILASLAELPSEYRWSNRFIFMDQHEAVAHLEKFRKNGSKRFVAFFDQVFNTNNGNIDQDAQAMVTDAGDAIAEINSSLVAEGYYTSVVVLMDENRDHLESSAQMIKKSIERAGFSARIETINTVDAFLGSIPGHGVENVRRPLLNTLNLSDLLPTSSIWTGAVNAPCPFYQTDAPALMQCVTHGATPFRLNLHVRDLGHTFMFGPTGSGKSTHLALLAAQLRRYANMSVFVFDKGMSMYPLAAAIRGTTRGETGLHFTIGGDDDKLSFCPLQFLETKSDRAWAMDWIATILALNDLIVTPGQRNAIAHAILAMSRDGSKTLSEFTLTVQDEAIREALKIYTIDGDMGHLLDANEDGLALSDFTVFEIEDLMNLGDKYALPVLLYLFRRIERALNGQPAAIILDEAWLMLGHKVFSAKIQEWLRVLRKANCLVLMATQNLSDAVSSGIFNIINESTPTKIYLPNPAANGEDASALYKRMGLNTRQISILASAVQKREYYYMSENGRRLYDLAVGPLALAFIGNSDKDSIVLIKKLEAKFGHDWVEHWLAIKGLKLDDYGVAA